MKSKMARERKAAEQSGAKSQLKVNEAAKNIMCMVCRQTFLLTIREKALQEHIDSKHSGKAFKEVFPMVTF